MTQDEQFRGKQHWHQCSTVTNFINSRKIKCEVDIGRIWTQNMETEKRKNVIQHFTPLSNEFAINDAISTSLITTVSQQNASEWTSLSWSVLCVCSSFIVKQIVELHVRFSIYLFLCIQSMPPPPARNCLFYFQG